MKKIVSAAALAALTFSAFAADLKLTQDIKFQPKIASFTIPNEGDTAQTWFSIPSSLKDTVAITLTEGPVEAYLKTDVATDKIAVNAAYAKIGVGAANFWAFYNDARFTNRVTTDQNDLSFIESNYAAPGSVNFMGKLGVNNKASFVASSSETLGALKGVGVDVDAHGTWQGTKKPAFVLDYTLSDVLPGKLLFKFVAKYNGGKTAAKAASTSWSIVTLSEETKVKTGQTYYNLNGTAAAVTTNGKVAAGDYMLKTETAATAASTDSGWEKVPAAFTYQVSYSQDDLGYIDFIANVDKDKTASFAGFYNTAKAVDGLNATAGFTYGFDNQDEDAKVTNMAADFRARYAVNEALAAGVYVNWTSNKVGDNDAQGLVSSVLNANYKVNDVFKAFVEAGMNLLTNSDVRKAAGTTVAAQLGGIITPSKGAKITTAVQASFTGLGADVDSFKATYITIPLSLRVTL